MKSATLAIALTAAICTLSGCLSLGDTNEVYPPTVGRELTDLRMSAERGAMSPQEYEAKKAQILAGRRGAAQAGRQQPEDPFAPHGMAQVPEDPQWQQQQQFAQQPPEGFAPQMQQQMQMSPQDMQYQQPGQYSPEMLQQQMQQQQMQQPQMQQLPAEGWH